MMKRFRSFLQRRRQFRGARRKSVQAQPQSNPPAPAPVQRPLQQQDVQQIPAPVADSATSAWGPTLNLALENQTSSNNVFAFVTGRAIDNGNSWVLLQNDGVTPYYPTSPNNIMQPLGANCAIKLGAPGSTTQCKIPHIAGGRIWFSIDRPITFYLNPGPELVEPSVTNPSDPNAELDWGFAEFTWNSDQLYANITYVDFVSMPIALTLDTQNSGTMHVSGMNTGGLQQVADNLRQQAASDGQGWDQLIVNRSGTNQVLRILSPNQGMVILPNLFSGYYDSYVRKVYQKFQTTSLSIDTQAAAGIVSSEVTNGSFNFKGSQFPQPSTSDIFTCNTGPFATGYNAQTNSIIPRLAAAFNRSTLLLTDSIPAPLNSYYQDAITNHYSRIVHQANLDGKGYAFPYDDVQPTNAGDQSGEVHAGDPTLFTVTVGGSNAHI